MVASKVCSLLLWFLFALLGLLTIKLAAHSSGGAPVGTLLTSAPCLQTVLWSRAEPRLLWGPSSSKSKGSSGGLWPSKSLQDERVQMTVMGPGCQEQAEIRAEDAGSCQQSCQRYLFPSYPDLNVTGAVDGSCLLCTGEDHVLATAAWTTESSTSKEGHDIGRGLWRRRKTYLGHCSKLFGNALLQLLNKKLP